MFTWADYLVLAIVLALSAAIGFYYACAGGRQRTTDEYIMGDYSTHWFPVGASILASFISTQTMIGLPGEIYAHGATFAFLVLPAALAGLIAVYITLPVYRQLDIISVNQYLDMRFGIVVKYIGLVFSVTYLLTYSSLVVYGPALALSAVTGLSLWTCIFSVLAVAVFYTCLGGLKAVLWADTLQMFIMIGGVLAMMITGLVSQGGIANVWESNRISGRLDFLEMSKFLSLDPRTRHTLWSQLSTGLALWTSALAVSQSMLTRAKSVPTETSLKYAFLIGVGGLYAFYLFSSINGLLAFDYFKFCDPIKSGRLQSTDQLYPLMVLELFGHLPGLPGFILASIFSASLSTISTTLGSVAAVLLQDVAKPLLPGLTDYKATIVTKVLVILTGLLVLALVFLVKNLGSGIFTLGLSFSGVLNGSTVGILLGGMCLPCINKWGVLIGSTLSTLFAGWIGIGAAVRRPYVYNYPITTTGCNITEGTDIMNITIPQYDPASWNPHDHYRTGVESLYDISYAWFLPGTAFSCILFSVISSLLISQRKVTHKVARNLLSPAVLGIKCQKIRSFLEKYTCSPDTELNNANDDDAVDIKMDKVYA